jgi:hypothetical protein
LNADMLTERLRRALTGSVGSPDAETSPHETAATLLDIYALHLSPIEELHQAVEWQHHPGVAEVKGRLEQQFLARLQRNDYLEHELDVATAFRRIAHEDRVPAVYEWLAQRATRAELSQFVAFEGGPDADFDDLVAICQLGLSGLPKMTLAANYWDEMGRGDFGSVHTELHRQMVGALALPTIRSDELPLEALERKVLNGYLATNRSLHPELIGSLGLTECQAGPRCRRVIAAMKRLDVADAALPFYEEHAVADPRHGKDWIERAVIPLVEMHPSWGPRILRGAQWRATVNRSFFARMEQEFMLVPSAA